jgi:hypothetical protein
MATYTQGALLAGFLLAFWRLSVDGSGYLWSAPLSVAFVFATAWHGPRSAQICALFALIMLVLWLALRAIPDLRRGEGFGRTFLRTLALFAALFLLVCVNRYGVFAVERNVAADPEWVWLPLAFPWYVPLGSTVAFVFGCILARTRTRERAEERVAATTAPA